MNGVEFYENRFCSKCKTKTCQPAGGMVYATDPSAKVFCALSMLVMLQLDRGLAKKKG